MVKKITGLVNSSPYSKKAIPMRPPEPAKTADWVWMIGFTTWKLNAEIRSHFFPLLVETSTP